MTDDLVAFINARLEDDERAISYAGPSVLGWATFRRDDGEMDYTTPVACYPDEYVADGRVVQPAKVIEVYDSARVLAEVAAKRRCVDDYLAARRELDHAREHHAPNSSLVRLARHQVGEYERPLRYVGLMFEWHPDYRQDWAPSAPVRCTPPNVGQGAAPVEGVLDSDGPIPPAGVDQPLGAADCPCLTWTVADMRQSHYGTEHHLRCDGTGQLLDKPREVDVDEDCWCRCERHQQWKREMQQ